ncbi:exo-beta-N-acetylmuramidase NamZ domain-containing protein [Labilibaculum sp.]|uniref:exo-beta-N-acetylmuramidase NamZ family protein n=1 Tax=Labilibaculum sp. TaxID=2060723 RepID=UPI003566C60D
MRKIKQWSRYSVLSFCFLLLQILSSCAQKPSAELRCGAERFKEYLPFLQNKRIALVANQSSLVNGEHLLDVLLGKKVQITKLFSPEHGFRGEADAGEKISNETDSKTGLPIVSLYGKHYKPSVRDLKGIDLVLFDIQDVGVRFYTYLSTLHYVMEACAEQGKTFIVLDRPNPNGQYVDGPVLDMKYSSFVGMHPVPVVYGMSIGEYAQMINGEGWLKNKTQCDLRVISCTNWNREDAYVLPVKSSPNLPNQLSLSLYPSLCFFEGTVVSAGRGTDHPFQCYGHPDFTNGNFVFTPRSILGASKYPKFKGMKCVGYDLRKLNVNEFREKKKLDLSFLLTAYGELKSKDVFFNSFFVQLAGTDKLRLQIENHFSEEEIRRSWQNDLQKFSTIRAKYLLYPDFGKK